mmetsp:Transcript_69853/g.227286  ORF Transcript_69853/g.227286 Transcript_69853/m.227286 type:complete len:254 (+) Transcript_69853:315-1076(+)
MGKDWPGTELFLPQHFKDHHEDSSDLVVVFAVAAFLDPLGEHPQAKSVTGGSTGAAAGRPNCPHILRNCSAISPRLGRSASSSCKQDSASSASALPMAKGQMASPSKDLRTKSSTVGFNGMVLNVLWLAASSPISRHRITKPKARAATLSWCTSGLPAGASGPPSACRRSEATVTAFGPEASSAAAADTGRLKFTTLAHPVRSMSTLFNTSGWCSPGTSACKCASPDATSRTARSRKDQSKTRPLGSLQPRSS